MAVESSVKSSSTTTGGTSSLGVLEAVGFVALVEAMDAMVKAAQVELLPYDRIGSGRLVASVRGEVAAVRVAVEAGRAAAERVGTVSSLILANPDTQIFGLLNGHEAGIGATPEGSDAVGIVEAMGMIPAIAAADTMVKAAKVSLGKSERAGGGRVAILVRGDIASVRAAVEAGAARASTEGEVIAARVVPNPLGGLASALFGR